MAEFLTAKGMASTLEDIISEAKSKLFIVSPYLQVSEIFELRLNTAAQRGVSIKILYGKDELKPKEMAMLTALPNVELIFIANLHAKCYINESEAIIGSMNFYNYSEVNNFEMGVLLKSTTDREAFKKAMAEIDMLIGKYGTTPAESATVKPKALPMQARNFIYTGGYCIRCKAEIGLDTVHPYCKKCYTRWREYSNDLYPENYCHSCGTVNASTMVKPQCYSCWQAN